MVENVARVLVRGHVIGTVVRDHHGPLVARMAWWVGLRASLRCTLRTLIPSCGDAHTRPARFFVSRV